MPNHTRRRDFPCLRQLTIEIRDSIRHRVSRTV
jgi:hypothetical protein